MKRQNIILLLSCIVLIGGLLRFYKLGTIPAGFHRDEAFLGYNAYSLLKTGRDMNGHILPIHFESFVYSPGGYSYAAIPAIALFGLNTFSVRFPAAFFGTITILLTFILAGLLFTNKKGTYLGLLSSFILAISPWHINLSRTSAESILVVFFITLGVILCLTAIKRNSLLLTILGFFSFSITLTIYQAPRAFLPLFLPILFLIYAIHQGKIRWIQSIVLFMLLIILPVLFILKNPKLTTRITALSIFSSSETKLVVEEQIREDGVMHIPVPISRVFHNKAIGFANTFLNNYFSHFTYSFLFTDAGFPERYRVPGVGLLFISFIPLLLLGLFMMAKNDRKVCIFLVSWILLSFVGSALTYDDIPNLQRTVIVFPALAFIIAYGAYALCKKKLLLFIASILCILLMYEFGRYLLHYSVQQQAHRPWNRHVGYQEMVETVNSRLALYKGAIITNRESAPAIFFLFFSAYDPIKYIKETSNSKLRDFDRVNFDRYSFSLEQCPLLEQASIDPKTGKEKITCYGAPDYIFVNSGLCDKPKYCANTIKDIKRGDGTTVFSVLDFVTPPATVSVEVRTQ